MVDVRAVPEHDLDAFRRLHNAYVDRDESLDTVRGWHRDHPELLVGTYDDGGDLVGLCLGRPFAGDTVELATIAVVQSRQRRGIGTALLSAFEDGAAGLGFSRVSLGSAGGYVDEFSLDNGNSPASVLVRLDPDDVPEDYREMGYVIVDERMDGGTKKLYVGVDGFDQSFVEEVRDAFDDPEAIYIMAKDLDGQS